MLGTRPLIAVVDDEPQMCKALNRLLKTHGYEVVTFGGGEELLASCATRLPACVLLDLHMPGMSGFEALDRFAKKAFGIPIVVITGHDKPDTAERVRALGAADYLLKPLDESQLLVVIRKVVKTT